MPAPDREPFRLHLMPGSFAQAEELLRAGRIDEARDLYTRAVDAGLHPDLAHFRLAGLAYSGGRLQESVQHLRRAVELSPDNAEYRYNLGSVLRAAGDLAEADRCYRQALSCDPEHVSTWIALGLLARQRGALSEAERSQREALRLAPDQFPAWLNLGNTLLAQGRAEEAAASYREALERNPRSWQALSHLGRAQMKLGRVREALPCFQQSIRLAPQEFEPNFHLAECLYTLGQFDDARQPLRVAVARQRDNTNVALQVDFACFHLRMEDFQRGWDLYEARLALPESAETRRAFPLPRWKGDSLAGKTLLIACEQGLGDEIMFASLFPEVAAEAGHCILECDARLAPLFQRSFPASTVFPVDRTDPGGWFAALPRSLHDLPQAHTWSPAASLARFRRRDPGAFPRHHGYLAADPEKAAKWRNRLTRLGPGLRIGLSWRGGTPATHAELRTIPLERLEPLLAAPAVHWISLQYADCQRELQAFTESTAIQLHHWREAIDDYDETAALVDALDLVISVCTAVVHLGGALGRPVWAMVPYVAEWRYGFREPRMPWYPATRLFRQPEPNAWEPTIAEVRRELDRLTR